MSQRNGHATGGAGSPTLPADAPPARGFPAAAVIEHERALLQKAVSGQLPPAPFALPLSCFDSSLDETQQDAVCRAIASPDLFVIQGPSGTGKTRIALEIVRQEAKAGGRILFLSPDSASLDAILPGLAANVHVSRRIGPGESLERLPPAIARLTDTGRHAAARDDLLARAQESVRSAEERLRTADARVPHWDELAALRVRQHAREQERAGLRQALSELIENVRLAIAANDEPTTFFIQRVRGANASHARKLAAFDSSEAEVKLAQAEAEKKRAAAEESVARLRPLATALREHRWYKPSFWKARADATLPQNLADAESQLTAANAELADLQVRQQKSSAERLEAEQEHQNDVNRWTDDEIDRRKKELTAAEAELETQAKADALLEEHLTSILGPVAKEADAGRDAAQRELAEAKAELERARLRFVEVMENIETLVSEACPTANVVAGPVAGLALDRELTVGGGFTLLVIEDAHRLAEPDFLAAARLAPRWVLLGEPAPAGAGRSRSRQSDFFARLAVNAKHDVWTQDGENLICRLHAVRGADRKRLECEPVADSPHIELRVFAPLNGEPTLAEVAFPHTTDPAEAREFLFRELGEITCQPKGRTTRWETNEAGLLVRFGASSSAARFAVIGNEVREELAGLDTQAIHFGPSWSEDDARAWLAEHVGQRDSGRLVTLGNSYRACPGLAHWMNRAFATGFTVPAVDNGRHVEFLAVPDLDPRRRRETNGRPHRVGGAGYEIDLGDAKQRAALHADFSDLPARGFVNVPEAQALARYLESQGSVGAAVTSPFPTQVTVLRRLFARSARLANIRVLDPGEAGGHECDVLIVSLTRSHVGRAVTFGEAPAVMASLLARARKRVLFAGDPGTLARRLQWEGPVDHLDAADAARERGWVAALADCPRVSPPRHRPAPGESVRA